MKRRPTRHERLTGRHWDTSYQSGPPPWDIGFPQPAVSELARTGACTGPVLDVGCGTGENTLEIAGYAAPVQGVDVAPTAIAEAQEKAARRGIDAQFSVGDALALDQLDARFATVLDSGLYHTFDDDERVRYVDSLGSVIEPRGILYLLCFSDVEPGDGGPRRVSKNEIHDSFKVGWLVEDIRPGRFATRFGPEGAAAWIATVRRDAPDGH